MNNLDECLEYLGTIEAIKNGTIYVKIVLSSDCSACHAKTSCGVVNTKDSIVEIIGDSCQHVVGDKVTILSSKSMGFKALFLGYILPFLLVIFTLIIGSIFLKNEVMAGILSLSVLIPYYGILHLFREKLQNSFIFKIKDA